MFVLRGLAVQGARIMMLGRPPVRAEAVHGPREVRNSGANIGAEKDPSPGFPQRSAGSQRAVRLPETTTTTVVFSTSQADIQRHSG